jgi:hypothetical protein
MRTAVGRSDLSLLPLLDLTGYCLRCDARAENAASRESARRGIQVAHTVDEDRVTDGWSGLRIEFAKRTKGMDFFLITSAKVLARQPGSETVPEAAPPVSQAGQHSRCLIYDLRHPLAVLWR